MSNCCSGTIRTIALCIIRKDSRLFLAEGYDSKRKLTYYRPLGGTIEFGEYGKDTVVREFREETCLEVGNIRYICTIENLFTYEGAQGHEIVLLYEGEFLDKTAYEKESLDCIEDGELHFKAV